MERNLLREIEEATQNLSENFTGLMSEREDDLVEFSGRAQGFGNEDLSSSRYSIKVETGANDIVLALTDGPFKTDRVAENVIVPNSPALRVTDASLSTTSQGSGQQAFSMIGNGFLISNDATAWEHRHLKDETREINKAISSVQAVLADGIENFVYLYDKDIYLKVSPKDSTKPISMFKEFVKKNASRVIGMVISASENSPIFNEVLHIQPISPFKNIGDTKIFFQDSLRPNQFVKDKIEIKTDFQFDDQKVVYMTIPKNTTAEITFLIGGVFNQATALEKKATKALKPAIIFKDKRK